MSSPITTRALRQMHADHVAAHHAEWDAMRKQFDVASEVAAVVRGRIIERTSPATVRDYGCFLALYLGAGGQPTHFYDYPMDRREFRLVAAPLDIQPLYGAQALCLIVLAGVTVTGSGGHIEQYRMDDPLRSRFVPIYSDSEVSE